MLIGVIVAAYIIIPKIIRALYNKGEQIVLKDTHDKSEELLQTVVNFKTKAPLEEIHNMLSKHVVGHDEPHAGMAIEVKNQNRIVYALGGWYSFKSELSFAEAEGTTTASYRILEHVDDGGVSKCFKEMMANRNEVISAFKEADPNVEISTSSQQLYKSKK